MTVRISTKYDNTLGIGMSAIMQVSPFLVMQQMRLCAIFAIMPCTLNPKLNPKPKTFGRRGLLGPRGYKAGHCNALLPCRLEEAPAPKRPKLKLYGTFA